MDTIDRLNAMMDESEDETPEEEVTLEAEQPAEEGIDALQIPEASGEEVTGRDLSNINPGAFEIGPAPVMPPAEDFAEEFRLEVETYADPGPDYVAPVDAEAVTELIKGATADVVIVDEAKDLPDLDTLPIPVLAQELRQLSDQELIDKGLKEIAEFKPVHFRAAPSGTDHERAELFGEIIRRFQETLN